MRRIRRHPIPPKEGDIRIISKFLFWPKTISYKTKGQDVDETRWFEKVNLLQRYYNDTEWFTYFFVDADQATLEKTRRIFASTNKADHILALGILGFELE